MKILGKEPFTTPVYCCPGDILKVTWTRDGKQVARMEAKIKEGQLLDHAVLVEYDDNEIMELESALGVFAGQEANNEDIS